MIRTGIYFSRPAEIDRDFRNERKIRDQLAQLSERNAEISHRVRAARRFAEGEFITLPNRKKAKVLKIDHRFGVVVVFTGLRRVSFNPIVLLQLN